MGWRPELIVLQPTPFCNINCDYCYLRNRADHTQMSAAVVDAICERIFPHIAPDATPTIIWHAGEPTVVPLIWYRAAYEKLSRHAPPGARFSFQSNGVFLSDAWITFLQDTQSHFGLSIDGPQDIHDRRRKTKNGRGTFALAVDTLHRLQDHGIRPSVVSVLHPEALHAPDEYFDFYRDHKITHVSFSIDEAEGANGSSSFSTYHREAVIDFQLALLVRSVRERYPLHIKEIERIAHILAGAPMHNEQVEPWQVLVVAADGNVSTFSPEFMEIKSTAHRNFCFGNILRDDFITLRDNNLVATTHQQICEGIARCRLECAYFSVCGGGAPANKMQENGSLETSETLFCRLSVQAASEALRKFAQWSATRTALGEGLSLAKNDFCSAPHESIIS